MKKIAGLTGILSLYTFLQAFLFTGSTKTPVYEAFAVDTLASGLSVPWDIVFLPGRDMLFTERPGRVRLYRNNQLVQKPVLTIGDIEVKGKMGLLGCCLHPAFAVNHFVYLAYNYRSGTQTFLRVARYEFISDSLQNPVTIIENIPGVFNHTGCRLKFGADKKLYVSTGDADVPRLAQDLKVYNGKILRLEENGTVPADNPFIKNDTALHEIWTYGHRNPQGMAFQPGTNYLFSSEHGPTGGDEINLIARGNNYGWPVIHHRNSQHGMMMPLMEFTPSIGPAEALFYSGKAFPFLKGHLLVACMRGEAILDVELKNNKISSYNFLLKNKFGRIRALAEGPDGFLYFSTSQVDPPESNLQAGEKEFDMIVRLKPAPAVQELTSLAFPQERMQTAITATDTAKTKVDGHTASRQYAQLCAGCHGGRMEGKEKVPSLVDKEWLNGSSKQAIKKSIAQGIVSKGMPAWEGVLTPADIDRMADHIRKGK